MKDLWHHLAPFAGTFHYFIAAIIGAAIVATAALIKAPAAAALITALMSNGFPSRRAIWRKS